MVEQDGLLLALSGLIAETTAAFDWLAGDIDRSEPVTFVPNPGNIGDAAINLACFLYLKERFASVEIRSMTDSPRTECVFVGGGGNAVEPLYVNVRDFLESLPPGHRLFMFPATLRGYSQSLQRIASSVRILCREPVSLAYAASQVGSENVMLAHDAAFLLASPLRDDYSGHATKIPVAKCRLFRADKEGIHSEIGSIDIMTYHQSDWTDMQLARDNVWAAARYLAGFGEVDSDRLHCAIIAAILGRRTTLRANCYFKNAAVFAHSLSRLPNTTFLPAT